MNPLSWRCTRWTEGLQQLVDSQTPVVEQINAMPIKTASGASVFVGDMGKAQDAGQLQTNIVRVDGQHSVYSPVFKQGAGSNMILFIQTFH